jgi:hypothetical protein
MVDIDFDKADRLANSISELTVDCRSIISAGKAIDAGRVSSFSPGTVSATSEIKASLEVIPGLVSTFYNNYVTSINMYRELYEEIGASVDNIESPDKSPKGANNAINQSKYTIGSSVKNGKMLKVTFEGKTYYIANTKINCFDYEAFVKKNKTYQDAGVGAFQCQTLSQIYAVDMLRGTKTTAKEIDNPGGLKWSPYIRMENFVQDPNSPTPIINFTYNELSEGRPVTLQVSQINSDNHERHWVTVVGYEESVKTPQDLNPDTMLVLDCVDGDLQTLSKSRAQGGHERRLYKWNGVYQAGGATDRFIREEVM